MSAPGTDAAAAATTAAAGSPEFSVRWRRIVQNECNQTPGTSPTRNDLQSRRIRNGSRLPGSNIAGSPGDEVVSQDIFWDSTSPSWTGSGNGNSRAVEISDIVNRIAPKNIKPQGTESSLLHWIDDGPICTPENPKPRVRKRSSRHSSVKDLMELAKQFDKNMQQDEETSVQPRAVTSKLHKAGSASDDDATDPKCPSTLEQAEAELRALFDSSTQGVSRRLSEASASSQDRRDRPETSASADRRQSEAEPADKLAANKLVEFEDEWDSDDLLSDSLIQALSQDPNGPLEANPKTAGRSHTDTTNMDPAHKPLENLCKTSFSSLQELCPKPKTKNRSTFKLEPNPHFQTILDKEASKSSFTVLKPKPESPEQNPATGKTVSNPQPDEVTNLVTFFLEDPPVKDVSDSLWDNGDYDAFLYQVCDSMENIYSSQPNQVSPRNCEEKPPKGPTGSRHQNTTDLYANAERPGSSGSNRRSSASFVRSNSLPVATRETGNYQGWSLPLRGADHKSGISQSFPGGHVGLEAFNQGRDASRAFQAESGRVGTKPHTTATGLPQNSKSRHAAFKRNLSCSAIISDKVFVTSQTTEKCSAAEIERKKQMALARRRLKMQSTLKP
ncbi:uncharacterized protein si:dkey-78p8.1 [Fundulus heteroclitus]|uniref:uncharacterized protein si:dkey-78p8.1 n=1 Tax=Fundulus heteroclitus TaxID=8078 RepID=UPI00165CEB91|nr:uncharacterized protein si:dkey-78p8.1 [Fundulus heteroclitus]